MDFRWPWNRPWCRRFDEFFGLEIWPLGIPMCVSIAEYILAYQNELKNK